MIQDSEALKRYYKFIKIIVVMVYNQAYKYRISTQDIQFLFSRNGESNSKNHSH